MNDDGIRIGDIDNATLPIVYVVIVNWNTWEDTVECIESLSNVIEEANLRIVVVDNGSSDHSIDKFYEWAKGSVQVSHSKSPVKFCGFEKPVSCKFLYDTSRVGDYADAKDSLVFIRSESNLGFAGGTNLGLQYSLGRGDLNYVWLLNPDTVVSKGALANLIKEFRIKPNLGLCGSALYYYDNPEIIQALGGWFNPWIAAPSHAGGNKKLKDALNDVKGREFDYPVGASLVASLKFIKEIGLLSEDYFLYFEEIDWVYRGKKKFSITCSSSSIVFHKEGSSTKMRANSVEYGGVGDFYMHRNRLLFTRMHAPIKLPIVLLSMLPVIARSIVDHKRRMRAKMFFTKKFWLGRGK